jgi:hypothetical protein
MGAAQEAETEDMGARPGAEGTNWPPPPPPRRPILPGIDDATVRREMVDHEDKIGHLYKDTARGGGEVTIGVGHLLRRVEDAKTVVDVRPATAEEIEAAFKKIEAFQQPASSEKAYAAGSFDPKGGAAAKELGLDDIWLEEKDIDALLDADLRSRRDIAMQKLINDEISPDTVPPSIKMLLLDLQYNNGLGDKSARKHLIDPIRSRDWQRVKQEVRKYPISADRDRRRQEYVDEAIQWDAQRARQ